MSNCPTDQPRAIRPVIDKQTSKFQLNEKKVGRLDSWTIIAKKIKVDDCFSRVVSNELPPWRAIPSRSAAKLIGVSLQTLANWRLREIGPPSEPMLRGYGNRIYYKPELILEWMSSGVIDRWSLSAAWLDKWLKTGSEMSRDDIESCIQTLDSMQVFPEVRNLWRSFQKRPV